MRIKANCARPGRRAFLRHMGVWAGASLFGGCVSAPRGPEADAPVHVDIHCHVFNAQDLPVAAFLREVAIAEAVQIRDIHVRLARFAEHIEEILYRIAPTAAEETKVLAELDAIKDEKKRAERMEAARKSRTDLFSGEMSKVLGGLLKDTTFGALMEALEARSIHRWVEEVARGLTDPEKASLHVGYMLYCLSTYRFLNVDTLMKTYPKVRLFTPALVDMDYWVAQDAPTSLAEQVDVMQQIVRLWPGRLLPFTAYDPWRQLDTSTALQLVQGAVNEAGFAGVKLYPPMGFRPIDNAKRVRGCPPLRRGRGKQLDDALMELFAWCEAEEVPVMAHANDSNYANPFHGALCSYGAPSQWADTLKVFPKLRLNLGHFGGADAIVAASSRGSLRADAWPAAIRDLMAPENNVYADVGYFSEITGRRLPHGLSIVLSGDKGRLLRERLMYGSDWLMLAQEASSTSYYDDFMREYGVFFRDDLDAFAGGNALRYLGLDVDGKARNRLLRYYARQRLPEPSWLQAPAGAKSRAG